MNNNYNELYNIFKQANEERKKENFNAFFSGLESGLIEDLNRYYIEDKVHYERLLSNLKNEGMRVYRNSQGKHKIKFL